jgi:hypothetical protein
LKPHTESALQEYFDKIKKTYLLDIKKFDQNKMTAVTLLFEGTSEMVDSQMKNVYSLARKHGGVKAGNYCNILTISRC